MSSQWRNQTRMYAILILLVLHQLILLLVLFIEYFRVVLDIYNSKLYFGFKTMLNSELKDLCTPRFVPYCQKCKSRFDTESGKQAHDDSYHYYVSPCKSEADEKKSPDVNERPECLAEDTIHSGSWLVNTGME
jgi:hypothetical protein